MKWFLQPFVSLVPYESPFPCLHCSPREGKQSPLRVDFRTNEGAHCFTNVSTAPNTVQQCNYFVTFVHEHNPFGYVDQIMGILPSVVVTGAVLWHAALLREKFDGGRP